MEENFKLPLHLLLHQAFRECNGSSAKSNDRNRTYDGQQCDGERGRTLVEGLTMRDIRDCFVKGFLLSNGVEQPELYNLVKSNDWLTDDIYRVNQDNIDPIAVAQNMLCEIEKMMGIFPNIKTKGKTI